MYFVILCSFGVRNVAVTVVASRGKSLLLTETAAEQRVRISHNPSSPLLVASCQLTKSIECVGHIVE